MMYNDLLYSYIWISVQSPLSALYEPWCMEKRPFATNDKDNNLLFTISAIKHLNHKGYKCRSPRFFYYLIYTVFCILSHTSIYFFLQTVH